MTRRLLSSAGLALALATLLLTSVSGQQYHRIVPLFGDGAATTPTLAFASDPTMGFYRPITNQVYISTGKALGAGYGLTGGLKMVGVTGGTGGVIMGSAARLAWTLGQEQQTVDATLSRSAAGVLQVGSGTGNGATGALGLTTLTITATVFTNLGTPANGTLLYCSDCTIASPCAGAGTGALAKRLAGAWVCN